MRKLHASATFYARATLDHHMNTETLQIKFSSLFKGATSSAVNKQLLDCVDAQKLRRSMQQPRRHTTKSPCIQTPCLSHACFKHQLIILRRLVPPATALMYTARKN